MAYRPHGRANVNPASPRAFARCDRCGFIYNHIKLKFQYDYRGPQLQNLRFLVCDTCYDKPQAQLKPIVLTEDPLPILNARPEDYGYANNPELSMLVSAAPDPLTGIPVPTDETLITEDGIYIALQPTGKPVGLDPNAVPPLNGTKHFNVTLPVLSVTANGTTVITVTCNSVHGMVDNDQIAAEGLSNSVAMGFYSVKIVSATVFTYEVASPIIAGSLLTSTTRIATVDVGLPPNFTQIPQVGVING
jgi:hypothetical protein